MTRGHKIAALRASKRWTLQQLADAAGSDPGNIHRIEADAQDVGIKLLRRIAKALGTTVSQLQDDPPAAPETIRLEGVRREAKLAIANEWLQQLSDESLERFTGWARLELFGSQTAPKKRAD